MPTIGWDSPKKGKTQQNILEGRRTRIGLKTRIEETNSIQLTLHNGSANDTLVWMMHLQG